jgi:hypothetical protein
MEALLFLSSRLAVGVYVNLPFGALALWFIITRMPPLLPAGQKGRLDYITAILLIGALVPLVMALQLDKTLYTWSSPVTLAYLCWLSSVCFVLCTSLRSLNPILDLACQQQGVQYINYSLVSAGAAFLVSWYLFRSLS